MSKRLYVGNITESTDKRDLEDAFTKFGTIRDVWIARNPPGFAFIEFDDERDAEDACERDGYEIRGNRIRAELSRGRGGGRGGGGGGGGRGGYHDRGNSGCYQCGQTGHFARECPDRQAGMDNRNSGRGGDRHSRDYGDRYGGGGYGGYDRGGRGDRDRDRGRRYRSRSRSPRRGRSPDRRYSRSAPMRYSRSPRQSRSPLRKDSPTPRRDSPPPRRDSPQARRDSPPPRRHSPARSHSRGRSPSPIRD